MKNSIIILITTTLVACSGGGGGDTSIPIALISAGTSIGSGGSGGTSDGSVYSPTLTFQSSKTEVVKGDPFYLTWSTTNAVGCQATGDWNGTKQTDGTQEIVTSSFGNLTFQLTCAGSSGTNSAIKNVTVEVLENDKEGTCTNPHTAEFDKDYMGNFNIPMPQNSLPGNTIKEIGLKDFGIRWIYNNYKQFTNESWISTCSEDQYVKLMNRTTLRRLKEHGVEQVVIYNFGYWNNANAPQWTLDHSTKHINDDELTYIVDTAKEFGLSVRYVWQFLQEDKRNVYLWENFVNGGDVNVNMALLEKIMDAHEENILWQAELAEELGIEALSADWSAMWLDFRGRNEEFDWYSPEYYEMIEYYTVRLSDIIDKIKNVYTGKIWIESQYWNDTRIIDKVDHLIFSFPIDLLTEDENKNLSVDIVQQRIEEYIESFYNNWYCQHSGYCPEYSSFNKSVPWVFNIFAQSTTDFPVTGWIEDAFCTPGFIGDTYYECVQYEKEINFATQAIYYEGVFRALINQSYIDVSGITSSCAYWLTDSIMPYDDTQNEYSNGYIKSIEGFPNVSQSIRGKPAEKILKYWYTGEYESYEPDFE